MALSVLNMIGWGRILVFVFVLMILSFYIFWKSFRSGNTVNSEYLNRIPNLEYLTRANVPIVLNHIISLKQMQLFFAHFLEYLLLFLDDNVDEESE